MEDPYLHGYNNPIRARSKPVSRDPEKHNPDCDLKQITCYDKPSQLQNLKN